MEDKEIETNDYGHVDCPEGRLKIEKFIQSEFIHGRQWTFLLLEDKSIIMSLISHPENRFESKPVEQKLRLSFKTFSLMQLIMCQADKDFGIEMENTLRLMLGSEDVPLKIKASPKQDDILLP